MDITLTQSQFAPLEAYISSNPELQQAITVNPADGSVVLDVSVLQKVMGISWENIPQLTPPGDGAGNVDPGALGDKLNDTEKGLRLDMLAIMSLIHEMAEKNRKLSHQFREAGYQQRWHEMDVAIEAKSSEAALRFAAAMTQGAMQIGMGIASGAVGYKGLTQARQSNAFQQKANDLSAGPRPHTQQTAHQIKTLEAKAGLASAESQATLAQGHALAQVGMGASGMVGGGINYAADGAQIDQKHAELRADQAQASVDKENEFMQLMRDILADIRQKLTAIEESNNATARKIWA